MKAYVINEPGTVENLLYIDVAKPALQHNQVLVKTRALSINPCEVNARASDTILTWLYGSERPAILGWDISGEVVEVGDSVLEFKIGDQVFGMVNFSGQGKAYAEFVAAPADHLALKPESISHQQAAAATLAAITAYQALVDVANVKKGDKVLIQAASGGVGHFAVQIAKHLGAYVIGTSSEKNRDFILSLGADEHIDYTKEKISERFDDIDVAIDSIGGESSIDLIKAVKQNGWIINLISPEIPSNLQQMAVRAGINLQWMMVTSKGETINSIAKLLNKGHMSSHVHKEFPFTKLREAHLEVESRRAVGKVIVTI